MPEQVIHIYIATKSRASEPARADSWLESAGRKLLMQKRMLQSCSACRKAPVRGVSRPVVHVGWPAQQRWHCACSSTASVRLQQASTLITTMLCMHQLLWPSLMRRISSLDLLNHLLDRWARALLCTACAHPCWQMQAERYLDASQSCSPSFAAADDAAN